MSVIDEYLKKVSPQQRQILEHIRTIIREEVPEVDEAISYGMPGFKYKGKYLISFGSFRDHMSVFPGSKPIELCADKLKTFKTSRGTVQFTPEHPLPDSLLRELVRNSAEQIKG